MLCVTLRSALCNLSADSGILTITYIHIHTHYMYNTAFDEKKNGKGIPLQALRSPGG